MDNFLSEEMLAFIGTLSVIVALVNAKIITLIEDVLKGKVGRWGRYAITLVSSTAVVFLGKLGLGPKPPWNGDPPTAAFFFAAAVLVWVVSGGSIDLLQRFFTKQQNPEVS